MPHLKHFQGAKAPDPKKHTEPILFGCLMTDVLKLAPSKNKYKLLLKNWDMGHPPGARPGPCDLLEVLPSPSNTADSQQSPRSGQRRP